MNIDLNLIASILFSDSFLRCREQGINKDHIEGDALPVWNFIEEYYEQYRSVPSKELVEERFGLLLKEPKEGIDFWISEVKKRKLFEGMNSLFLQIQTHMHKSAPDAAFEEMRNFIKEEEKNKIVESPISSLASLKQSVLDKYFDAKSGKMGILTPWNTMNELTTGWYPKDLSFIVARASVGKCEAKGTEHVMYDGTIKKVEDIVVGDLLMGPDSKPRMVLSVCRGREEMFKIVPSKGESWSCNRSHILSLVCNFNLDSKHKKGFHYEYSVDQYLRLSQKIRKTLKLWRTGVEFKEKNVPYDPYWLGLYIGDGTRNIPEITKDEPELIKYYKTFCRENKLILRRLQLTGKNKRCAKYSFSTPRLQNNPLRDFVRSLRFDKFRYIPFDYKVNSYEKRLRLLAGLIDSDGYITNNGTYEITTKHKQLAEDVLFLARSLGFGATCREKKSRIISSGFSAWYYRIFIFGDINKIPCRIKRKKAKPKKRRTNALSSGFRITSKGIGEYYGFTLTGDGLYLLKDFTVSHNTFLAIHIASHAKRNKVPTLFITGEMSREDVAARDFAIEFKIQYQSMRKGKLSFLEEDRLKKSLQEYQPEIDMDIMDGSQGMKIDDIERVFEKTKAKLIVIDASYRIKARQKTKDRFENMAYVADDLKQFAQSYDKAVVATTQFNRDAVKKKGNPGMEDVALSDVINWNATNVFSMRLSECREFMEIFPLKVREGENNGQAMSLKWDFVTMNFEEVNRAPEVKKVKDYTNTEKDNDFTESF